ncbi:MYND-type domain-containing protein [Favolaschia claudopus]|uniref:MYND-type domain-containing protein n=1 Tax=Favolaschia claudopus TaxID=2862362 RepID=A0AAW0A6H2_9AGAR
MAQPDVFRCFFALPGMHNAMSDPVKWNAEWEALAEQAKDTGIWSPANFVESSATQLAAASDGMDSSMLEYQSLLGSLMSLQLALTRDALRYFGQNLESKWLNAGATQRGQHIMVGLTNACAIAKNLHDARMYCSQDFDLVRLRKNGKIILGWLKAVIFPDADKEQEPEWETLKPKYVPNPAWDAFIAQQQQSTLSESEKLALGTILVLRSKLLCHFMQYTMRSFVGDELPKIVVQKYDKKLNSQPLVSSDELAAVAKQMLGRKAAAKEDIAAFKERQRDRKRLCSYVGCGKPNDGEEKFSRCRKCWDQMQREVLYCSKECQTADWKNNHKPICGKPITFETASNPRLGYRKPEASSAPPVIGPAVGNFKRSPALATLVKRLNQSPEIDYIIKGSEQENCISYGHPEVQSLFRKFREKAMTTGDRASIAIMAHFLCWMSMASPGAVELGTTSEVIVAQFKKEYRFDELHLAVREMQMRQNMDPVKRPVLLFEVSPQKWANFDVGNIHRQVLLN